VRIRVKGYFKKPDRRVQEALGQLHRLCTQGSGDFLPKHMFLLPPSDNCLNKKLPFLSSAFFSYKIPDLNLTGVGTMWPHYLESQDSFFGFVFYFTPYLFSSQCGRSQKY
jgi:hypothetical protein